MHGRRHLLGIRGLKMGVCNVVKVDKSSKSKSRRFVGKRDTFEVLARMCENGEFGKNGEVKAI